MSFLKTILGCSLFLLKQGSSTTYCYDQAECAYETIADTYVYCYGYQGCYDATIDATNALCDGYFGCYSGDITVTSGVTCDSEYSCSYGDITSTGYVYCDGKFGCTRTPVVAESTLTCDGEYSCYYTTITGNYYTYCDGKYGCYYSTVTSEYNLYCDGEYSCARGTLQSGSNYDVYCGGDYSCYYSSITSGDDVYCDGPFGCGYYSTINAADYIYCDGEYGCYNSELIGERIYCNGDMGCYYSDISGANYVFTYGYYGSRYSTVNSSGSDTFRWYLGGYYASYGATLTCSEGDTCYVYCLGDTSCYGLTMDCYGHCSYTCDENCDACPTVNDYSSRRRRTIINVGELTVSEKAKELKEKERNEFNLKVNNIFNNFDTSIEDSLNSITNIQKDIKNIKGENRHKFEQAKLIHEENINKATNEMKDKLNELHNELREKENKNEFIDINKLKLKNAPLVGKLDTSSKLNSNSDSIVTNSNNNVSSIKDIMDNRLYSIIISLGLLFTLSAIINLYFICGKNKDKDNKLTNKSSYPTYQSIA